jgi:hypothetical protein
MRRWSDTVDISRKETDMTIGSPPIPEAYARLDGARADPAFGPQRPRVLKIGSPDAGRVLVLTPGRGFAAPIYLQVARSLVRAVPDLQVWAVDRRQQELADLSGFALDLPEARTYYREGLHRRVDAALAPHAARWGLEVLVADLRAAVQEASAGGRRRVLLGGHSLGALTTLAYAAWDFDGQSGADGLDGLLIMDGGVFDAYAGAGISTGISLADARGMLAAVNSGQVFEDATSSVLGLGEPPESGAIWWQLAALHALRDPHGPAALARELPPVYATDRPLTNAGLLGRLLDTCVPNPGYAVRSGRLSEDGDWIDDGPTPLGRVAEALAGPERSAREWCSPLRAMLDYQAVIGFEEDEVTDFLGLPLRHTDSLRLPLYAFESGFAKGTVGQAAERLAKTRPLASLSLHSDFSMTHQDVLMAAPQSNTFLRTVVPFLTSVLDG